MAFLLDSKYHKWSFDLGFFSKDIWQMSSQPARIFSRGPHFFFKTSSRTVRPSSEHVIVTWGYTTDCYNFFGTCFKRLKNTLALMCSVDRTLAGHVGVERANTDLIPPHTIGVKRKQNDLCYWISLLVNSIATLQINVLLAERLEADWNVATTYG